MEVRKKAVFVLGAPRSGTSATTGLLGILGLPLGEQLTPIKSWNPKGDFEDESTVLLNRQLVRDLDIDPYVENIRKIDWVHEHEAIRAKEKIKENLQRVFGRYPIFGLKHPRICLLLEGYIKAAEELSYEPYLVIVRRDAEEIIASLNKSEKQQCELLGKKRAFFSPESGNVFVNNFLRPLEGYNNYKKIVINFDDLLNDTEKTIHELRSLLPELKTFEDAKKDISLFLNKEFKHHNIQK